MTPHKHAAVIKAWADGAQIEWRERGFQDWKSVANPAWHGWAEYRVKPAPEFPKSSLSEALLGAIYCKAYGTGARYESKQKKAAIKAVADAAVKQYILDTEASK